MGKKGQIEIEEIVKTIIILLGIALIIGAIYLLRNNMASIFDSIKEFLRFGR